jgi:hypothetical protein
LNEIKNYKLIVEVGPHDWFCGILKNCVELES